MIGTDILNLKEFPDYKKRNEKRFFKDNFTKNEIEYIQLRNNPNHEFARLFSIKESLVKADNTLLKINFNRLEILSKEGNFSFNNYKISSSITENYCISFVLCP